MYVPSLFKADEPETLVQYIRDYSFGVLIVADDQGIEANHVPFYLSMESDNPLGKLQCHLARGNPVWQRIRSGVRVLAVFQGPNVYVSPAWYPTKNETGRVVPTWNYLAIHAQGSARIIEDSNWLKSHLHQLTNQHESQMDAPWSVDDAPEDYLERMMKGIVGVEINIEMLTGKLKASQNQPDNNRAGVKAALETLEGTQAMEMAKLIP